MHPNKRLNNAQIRDSNAEYLVTGSSAAPGICKIVRIALVILYSQSTIARCMDSTHESSKTDRILNVFHSRMTLSINDSHVALNLSYWGGTGIIPA